MPEQENVQQVQALYAAFGRGDIPAFMDALADDVEWVIPYPTDIPNGGTYHGKAGIQKWLGLTMANVQFKALEPHEYIAQGDKVVVLLHAVATIKRTGRDVDQEVAHVWTLRDGKIACQYAYEDTAAVVEAYHGTRVPVTENAHTSAPSMQP